MGSEGNWFAYLALGAWPFVAIVLYRTRSLVEATLWTILGAQLLLPEGTAIKIPMIPQADKISIPNLCALIGCALVARNPQRFQKKGFGIVEVLIGMFLIGPFITSGLNGDAILMGNTVLPGVGYYDAFSAAASQLLFFLTFFIGRRYLRTPDGNEQILWVLVFAGLFYSLPMLFEIRMSPQLNRWIYGFSTSSMITEGRYGGFRPVVFMGNGLIVAFFFMTSLVASIAFWRTRTRVTPVPAPAVTVYLLGVLILCKTTGVLVYSMVLGPLVRLANPRLQVRIAVILVSLALAYPALRSADLFPVQTLLDWASELNSQREFSLKTRFVNEDRLLAHAHERFLFGWGRYGRNRVYDEWSGRDMSLTDGRWIITLGTWGFFGFIAEFGLFALVVFRAASAQRLTQNERERIFLAALALIVAITLIEQLPNASLSPWSWLLAGSLLGRAEELRALAKVRKSRDDRLRQSEKRVFVHS